MGNHLGPFSEAPDWPEGQEQPVRAVGGQGHLRGVTRLPSKLETWFFLNPRFLGMGNHLGPFSEAPDWPEGQEQPIRAVGGQGHLRGVTRLPSKLETWFFLKLQVIGYGESFGPILRHLSLTSWVAKIMIWKIIGKYRVGHIDRFDKSIISWDN